jgi:hypothetical protein
MNPCPFSIWSIRISQDFLVALTYNGTRLLLERPPLPYDSEYIDALSRLSDLESMEEEDVTTAEWEEMDSLREFIATTRLPNEEELLSELALGELNRGMEVGNTLAP